MGFTPFICMKKIWLNFILHFSGRIHQHKEKLLMAPPLETILRSVMVLLLELLLFIISLPALLLFVARSNGLIAMRARAR